MVTHCIHLRSDILRATALFLSLLCVEEIHAQSLCATLGFETCLESRSSGITSGEIVWSDDNSTDLSAPTVPFVIADKGTQLIGSSFSLYSDHGLQGRNDPFYGLGSGPTSQISYAVEARPKVDSTIASSVANNLGQASAYFLAGGTLFDSGLRFEGQGKTELGVNHASALIKGAVEAPYTIDASNLVRPGYSGVVTPRAVATGQSYWVDSIKPSSNSGTMSFEADIEGSLTANSSLIYGIYAVDTLGAYHSILSTVVVGDTQPGAVSQHLVGSLAIDPGLGYRITGILLASATVPDFTSSFTGGDVLAESNFFNTAKLDSITLSPGLDVSYASGPLSYLSQITSTAAVPETATWALMVAGILALGLRSGRALRGGRMGSAL